MKIGEACKKKKRKFRLCFLIFLSTNLSEFVWVWDSDTRLQCSSLVPWTESGCIAKEVKDQLVCSTSCCYKNVELGFLVFVLRLGCPVMSFHTYASIQACCLQALSACFVRQRVNFVRYTGKSTIESKTMTEKTSFHLTQPRI